MTDDEIKAAIKAEVERQLANRPRLVPREAQSPATIKQAVHRPITSNAPGKA